ncbi:CYTH and CHAD domain-containing protein [Actinomadura craniellae]|uniref:CYTH and CHAD domain-containing protein n=1 Tax=Actinomadura craniellae TaxID=2231787 RepID=UPI0011BF7F04|nr:CYTH and CHAD domain-containing protein [Actinomadura craniellae]
MAEKHLEIERKYDAAPDFTLPDLTGLPGVIAVSGTERHTLSANYFDTADLRLAAHGITLRRRRGGEDAGWHLKMPAGPDSKQELRAPLGRAQVVPARLATLVTAYARGSELGRVAVLDTERTTVRLLGEDGAVLAEIADDAVSGRVEGAESADTWREIEVELVSGDRALLKAADKALRKAGAEPGSSASKLGRVLGDAVTRRAVARTHPGSAAEAVLDYLSAQVTAIVTGDPKARLAEDDAVHKMRVAVRRTRSTLKSCRRVLDRERTDPLQPELKWLADALGEVRDLEVLRMRFADRIAGLDELTGEAEEAGRHLLDRLTGDEQAAYRRLDAALKEPRYYALLDALEGLVAEPPLAGKAGRPADDELPRMLDREWRRVEKAYAAIADADDPDEARHDTRKVAKRARYAAELARPVVGSSAKQMVADAKRIQEVFGGYQDGVIAMEHLHDAARRAETPAEAFVLGVLYGVERTEAYTSRDHVEETWEQITGS